MERSGPECSGRRNDKVRKMIESYAKTMVTRSSAEEENEYRQYSRVWRPKCMKRFKLSMIRDLVRNERPRGEYDVKEKHTTGSKRRVQFTQYYIPVA